MSKTIRRPNEVATIDACMVVVTPESGDGSPIGVTSNTEVATEVQTEDKEANKLIVKNVLKAQKRAEKTFTGTKITLTDNLTLLELAQAAQGGEILRDVSGEIIKYTPPLVGKPLTPVKQTLEVYSACMDASGDVVSYEKTTYQHCTGEPFAYNAKDDEWRVPQYVFNSTPKEGEPPYTVEYVDTLPELADPEPTTPETPAT